MVTDYDICQLLQRQYDGEQFDTTIDISGVYCSVSHLSDCSVVMFRGSTTPLDFWRDFEGLMVKDAAIGGVEQGFITGLRDVKAHLNNIYFSSKNPLIIAGHSLGAARALLFSGLIRLERWMIDSVIVFGSPRPGGSYLKSILWPLTIRSYKNNKDPVTDVPIDLGLLEPYCEPRDFIMLDVPPVPNDDWGLVAPHRLSYYAQGVEKLCQ